MATTITTAPGVMHVTSPAVHQIQPTEHPATRYKNIFMVLGVTLVISGVLSFILGGVGLSPSVTGNYVYVASGLWGGAWFIASGALAIATGVKANSCNVIGGMVVSILTSLVAFGVGVTESVLAGIYCGPSLSYFSYLSCSEHFTGIHATIAFLAFLSCILAIIHSSFCCCGGCGQSNYQGRVLATTTVTTVPGVQFPLQHAYGNVAVQPMGQVYYPPMGQGQPQLMQGQPQLMQGQPQPMQGQPQLMQGQPQLIQGQQSAAYPPAQNPYPAISTAGYGTQPRNPYPATATAGYGTQPQTQSAFAPPPYSTETQGQKQNFQ